ncbi:hypothetical protein BGZ68_008106 [Mortierella alpina]|nr:hypothetical protein BGZ68_008106 [Mortierella alpina]
MAKAFHGRIEDTRDALIILEACRQGLLPRINRRLLAAEREGIVKAEPYDENSSGPATRTRQATTANPSLIEAGSVFVFDEDESRICRWTDGKIWSPSRICGNFLVYRELYRKLPEQKCWTAKDKASMKDGNGLKDKTLKETVKKENLVVLGCMKGTFVLKKDGLIKKTICVTGVELLPPEELRGRGNVASRLRTGKGAASNRPPGLKLAGIQHLVCYERPGAAMKGLHRPREYVQLRDLPISKTFVLTQKYRNPLQITPLPPDQLPIDAWDEYINSERIAESRNPNDSQVRPKRAKPSRDDDSGTTSSNDFMNSHSADFSTPRKRRSTSVASNEHHVFVKDEEFASAPSANTLVHDTQNWTSNSPTDSQLEVHGVKSKAGQWELLPFSADVQGHVEAASGVLLPSTLNHDGLHDGRALTDYEEEETSRRAAWLAEQAGTPVQTPSHGRLRQHDRNLSLSPTMPWALTNHPGDLPGTRPEAPEDWTPSGAPSLNDNTKGHMLVSTPNASSEHEEFTSNPTLPSMLVGNEVVPGTNELSLVAKSAFHEYTPSTISSSFHSERSCGLSLSSSLSLSPAGNTSSTNSPSTMRSPRSNILRRSESKTPLSPMFEHDEVEDSAVTSAAMILTSALSENQLSQKTLYHPQPQQQMRLNGQMQSQFIPTQPFSDVRLVSGFQGLTYDSSASFTGTGDEARTQQRRYMSPSNYLFPGAASSTSLDHSQISDASCSVPVLRPHPRLTTCSRETDSVSYQPSCTPSRQSSAHPTSTDSEDSKNRRQSPANDVRPRDPGEISQEEHFNRCGGDGLGYVFDQEPLGGVDVHFYSSGTRNQSFVGSTQPDLEATTPLRASQFTPGTLSAMHPSATDDSARSTDDLEVSADESLGKAEYLLHPQHSRLSQFSQLPSDPASESRQDRRSDRFSDENQPWALRRHEDAAQDMFPGLMDLRPRSSGHESSASENPHFGGALEQPEFLEDRLERERLARAMEALEDDDMSSRSELTDRTRSDDTGLLYSPTPA